MNRITLILATIAVSAAQLAAADPAKNIVLILTDDLGWADTTLYGKTSLYETPNIERLAARGMTLSRAYASPICSPTPGGQAGAELDIEKLRSSLRERSAESLASESGHAAVQRRSDQKMNAPVPFFVCGVLNEKGGVMRTATFRSNS